MTAVRLIVRAAVLGLAVLLPAGCWPIHSITDRLAEPYAYVVLSGSSQGDIMGFKGDRPSIIYVDVDDPSSFRVRATMRKRFVEDEGGVLLYLGWQVLPKYGIAIHEGVNEGDLEMPYGWLRAGYGWLSFRTNRIDAMGTNSEVLGLRKKILDRRKDSPPSRVTSVKVELVEFKGDRITIRVRPLNSQGREVPNSDYRVFLTKHRYNEFEGVIGCNTGFDHIRGTDFYEHSFSLWEDLAYHCRMTWSATQRGEKEQPFPAVVDRLIINVGIDDEERYGRIWGSLEVRLDPPVDTASAQVQATIESGNPKAEQVIAWVRHPDQRVAKCAANKLSYMAIYKGDKPEFAKLAPSVMALIEDEQTEERVRDDLVRALARMAKLAPESVPVLIKQLSRKDSWARSSAIEGLGNAGGAEARAAVPRIREFLNSKEYGEQQAAREALKKLEP